MHLTHCFSKMQYIYEQVMREETWINDPVKKKLTKIYDNKKNESEIFFWVLSTTTTTTIKYLSKFLGFEQFGRSALFF
jgi:hypothetical protein